MATNPCPRCSAENARGARFCSDCGSAIAGSPAQSFSERYGSVSPEAPVRPPQKRGIGPRLFVGLLLAVVAVAGLLVQSEAMKYRGNELQSAVASFFATPTPEPTLPGAIANAGTIDFGTAVNLDTLVITKPTTRFKATYPGDVCWVAHLSGTAGATSLVWSITRKSAGGSEASVRSESISIDNPDVETLAHSIALAVLHQQPGTYFMRYTREGMVVAEGMFVVVK
jgi:hypothetical protein